MEYTQKGGDNVQEIRNAWTRPPEPRSGHCLSVVGTGSFAAAGRQLGRATSAMSYTIANLELQLGVPLFDRDRTRKPTLTEAGAAVLSEAHNVRIGVDNLRPRSMACSTGLKLRAPS